MKRAIFALSIAAIVSVSVAAPVAGQDETEEPTTKARVEHSFGPAAVANAHRVDGKHAVGASASKAKRAGKLVATNKNGVLPSNIVKPNWTSIKGMPAGFADGFDDGAYVTSTGSCGADIVAEDFRWIRLSDAPRGAQYHFQVIPTDVDAWLRHELTETIENPDGSLTIDVLVSSPYADNETAGCNVRVIAFFQGISPAKAEARLADLRISSSKNKRR